MKTLIRWGKFNLVGAIGMALQLTALACFNYCMRSHYLLATAAAIELTLLHNFAWHWHYTWRDRRLDTSPLRALLRFHLSNGAVSMLGNLALMRLLVLQAYVPVLAANIVAIACCSVVNLAWRQLGVRARGSGAGYPGSAKAKLVRMISKLYAKWMYAWEVALTTRDTNRIERPLEWGFDHLADFGGVEAEAKVARGECSALDAMIALNDRIVAEPHAFFDYTTPTDFRIEMHHPQLYPTNVRPETLEQEREWRRQAEVGELRREPFLRFTSALRTPYPENDVANARWYEAASASEDKQPKQAMIVMPQWNADAFSHNVLCEMFNKFGISALRLSKPYHDVRRPAELERSDYAVSANVGRTTAACRQAVIDVRSCVDWLESQGYEHIGVLGTSLGSAYAFIAAAMDPRIRVCAFNHVSTQFGDVVWTGQSTRHVKAAFEHAGLTQDQVRAMFAGVSPMSFMQQFADSGAATATLPARRSLVIHATYDLTFIRKYSLEVLTNFNKFGMDYVSKVLPCGHYTTGETPYKYMDGWYMGSFVWREFRKLRGAA